MKSPHKHCNAESGEQCIPTPEGKKGEKVCVEDADCCPTPAFKRVRCVKDETDPCKVTSEVYYVDCDGAEIPDACEIPCPQTVLAKIIGGAVSISMGDVSVNLGPVIAAIQAACDKVAAAVAAIGVSIVAAVQAVVAAIAALQTALIAALAENCQKLAGLITALQAALIAAFTAAIEANTTGIVNAIQEACAKKLESLQKICDKLEGLEFPEPPPNGDVEECCTGGATAATSVCYNVPVSMLSGSNENCEYMFAGQELPNPYTQADVQATLPAGATIGDTPDAQGRVKICTDGSVAVCFRSFCRVEGDLIGSLTRICFVGLPNTEEEECTDFLRTWSKYEEPIGNTLTTQLSVQEQMLEKLCQIADGEGGDGATLDDVLEKLCDSLTEQQLQTAKLCLIDSHVDPAAPCPAEVPPEGLNKEARTLTLKGNVVANYGAGQAINLQNANGEACGTATAAAEPAPVFNAENNQTVVTIEECELDEGKTPVQITQATPVKATVVKAIKTIKTLSVRTLTPVLALNSAAKTMALKGDATALAKEGAQLALLDSAEKEAGVATVERAKYNVEANRTEVALTTVKLNEGVKDTSVKFAKARG